MQDCEGGRSSIQHQPLETFFHGNYCYIENLGDRITVAVTDSENGIAEATRLATRVSAMPGTLIVLPGGRRIRLMRTRRPSR